MFESMFLRTAQFLQISGLVEENGSSRCGFVLFDYPFSVNKVNLALSSLIIPSMFNKVSIFGVQRGAASERKGLQWQWGRKAKADLRRGRWQEAGEW